MCGCGGSYDDEELDDIVREIEEDEADEVIEGEVVEGEAIEVTEEFAIPVRIDENVEVE